jgi:hypothetical protein
LSSTLAWKLTLVVVPAALSPRLTPAAIMPSAVAIPLTFVEPAT